MYFHNIPQYTNQGHYRVDVALDYVERNLSRWVEDMGLDINPDFQRGHVWDELRQVAFVEHLLRGGVGSNEIRFNHPGWMGSFKGQFILVDGLQRLTAVRRFLNGEIAVLGGYISDYEDHSYLARINLSFRVNNLPTRAEVLEWYLEINTGGIVHTDDEIEKVQSLLNQEKAARIE